MKAVIMAGGKGTRISSISADIPKPMIRVEGKPVLQYQIEWLVRQGIADIILSIGHLGQVIRDYFGDGSQLGARITYYQETAPLGSGGALTALRQQLTEPFLLINGDIIFDIDLGRLLDFHSAHNALATLAAHPNSHPYDSGLLFTDGECRVTSWLHKEDPRTVYHNRVNAGVHVLSPEVLSPFDTVRPLDLDRDILKPLVPSGRLYAYDTPEYIHDMGTPERYRQVCEDVAKGRVGAKNLFQPQRAVFLDRDGTLNVYKGFLRTAEELELLPGVAEAIRAINASGYLAVVVTNQPVIARGECTWEELEQIHNTLETLLGKEGAYLDAIYVCPHHPDRGFEGERPEYKIVCDCRKPKPGLLLQAAEKYHIDRASSWMVGDSACDVKAGQAAGCHTALIGNPEQIPGVPSYAGLLEFVKDETVGR